MLYKLGRAIFSWIFHAVLKITVIGKENIPRQGGYILASNHLSNLDPILLGVVSCPRELHFMAKEELFKNPLAGFILKRVHAFPLKRDSADLTAIKEAIRRVRKGQAILLFPEGTRQSAGKFGEPLPGVGFLAQKLNVPVIPALITGTDQAMPKGAKGIRPAKVAVRFGTQITVERRMAYRDISGQIMEAIRNLADA
jgi:1-acyl-sn-glycerol-3-phosphate acyltransferase